MTLDGARYWQDRAEVDREGRAHLRNVIGPDEYHVGVDDNFFTLGGDSIVSLQTVPRARHAGLYLTTKDLFRHQTIAELAPVVTHQFPLDKIGEAFETIRSGAGLKMVVVP